MLRIEELVTDLTKDLRCTDALTLAMRSINSVADRRKREQDMRERSGEPCDLQEELCCL